MKCLQGHFLVARGGQLDPNFVQTVILIVDHSDQGGLGLVVNRLGDLRSRVFVGSTGKAGRRRRPLATRLYLGGPVSGPLMAVHTSDWLGEYEVLPGVFFSAKERNVRALVRRADRPYKIFVGYAGWSAGQLDREVEQGVWRIVAATPQQIFSESEDLWCRLSRQAFPVQLHELFDPFDLSINPAFN
jgi:putative transcriptional regulator